jgi:2'-hydroxyisoflavone reductase
MTTRRRFLQLSAATLGLRAAGLGAATTAPAPGGLRVLVLGGTGFIGPHQIEALLARGYAVTIFNRGRRPGLYGDRVEELIGDRDPDQGEGLRALTGDRQWDAVIDNSGYYPRHVRASAELLRGRVRRYLFVSTVAVYDFDHGDRFAEAGPLAPMPDPENETMAGGRYGPLKAECDRIVREVMGEQCTVVRPPYIVGPGDTTNRFTYWVDRIHRGGDVLGPAAPEREIQFVDARDLCEWIVELVSSDTGGIFNAAGPSSPISREGLLWGLRAMTSSPVRFHWPSQALLEELEIEPPMLARAFPVHFESGAAMAAGLRFRPLAETAADTLNWWHQQPAERRDSPRGYIAPEKERAALSRLIPSG